MFCLSFVKLKFYFHCWFHVFKAADRFLPLFLVRTCLCVNVFLCKMSITWKYGVLHFLVCPAQLAEVKNLCRVKKDKMNIFLVPLYMSKMLKMIFISQFKLWHKNRDQCLLLTSVINMQVIDFHVWDDQNVLPLTCSSAEQTNVYIMWRSAEREYFTITGVKKVLLFSADCHWLLWLLGFIRQIVIGQVRCQFSLRLHRDTVRLCPCPVVTGETQKTSSSPVWKQKTCFCGVKRQQVNTVGVCFFVKSSFISRIWNEMTSWQPERKKNILWN